jgi:tripartite-type tricarboxylate transporter receptor subunit TctC
LCSSRPRRERPGVVAANFVATSKPDGYTLLLVPGGHAPHGATFKTLPFDAVKSFEWISNIITSPFCGVSKIAVPVPRRDR